MSSETSEKRFLQYQIRAIRRFQRHRGAVTPLDFNVLALEWVNRFAAQTRSRWERRVTLTEADVHFAGSGA